MPNPACNGIFDEKMPGVACSTRDPNGNFESRFSLEAKDHETVVGCTVYARHPYRFHIGASGASYDERREVCNAVQL